MTMGKQELTGALLAGRTMGGGSTAAASPMRIIADLVSSGVCERHPNLMLNVIEFNAGWLANYMGSMDKAWRTGTGQDPHWWLGFWDDGVDPHDQKLMGRMFKINDRWPLPLKPSEYVKRNIKNAGSGHCENVISFRSVDPPLSHSTAAARRACRRYSSREGYCHSRAF